MAVIIVRGDARNLPFTDSSVDLIVTSPPYFGLRAYQDDGQPYSRQIGAEATPAEYVGALLECTREWMRVLKPRGSIWVNLGDKYNAYNGNRGDGNLQRNRNRQNFPTGHGLDVKGIKNKSLIATPWRYAIGCIDQLGLILRAEVVWFKPNGMPESVSDRVRRSHETWFHLVKQPRYFCDKDAVSEPGAGGRHRIPGSVWAYPVSAFRPPAHIDVEHTATFPAEIPARIIRGWCPEGGVVVDPFGGTGTTAMAADVLGRVGISVDMSADYCRAAAWKTADDRQRARVLYEPRTLAVSLEEEAA